MRSMVEGQVQARRIGRRVTDGAPPPFFGWSPSPVGGGLRRFARAAAALFLGFAATATAPEPQIDEAFVASDAIPANLSAFGFFAGGPDRPAPLLIPYTLATPLFSDHADKRRWIFLPSNTRITADGDGLVQFPVGAAIIKSFGYAQADGSYRTIETRLLLHRANGWVALPYVWRADGSDADLALGGRRLPVTFTAPTGQAQTISYAVPNRNQCKECHGRAGVVTPIGPQLRNLELSPPHRALVSGADWQGPRLPHWDNASEGTLDSRARAYLDVNCAHCHNPQGAASNSGLFLEFQRPAGIQTGVMKRPVAAGRGSGGLDFDIVPGHPEQSILLYRMRSHEPGIAMPEVGRTTTHAEGVALIERWIAAMR